MLISQCARCYAGLALLTACASARLPSRDSLTAPIQTIVEVRNESFYDLVVYLRRGLGDVRLGRVPAAQRRQFRLSPAQFVDGVPLRLLAGKRARELTHTSVEFNAEVGSTISWVVMARQPLSTVHVRGPSASAGRSPRFGCCDRENR